MDSITIITIVVVALLTVTIFGLTWLGYSSCLKAYKLEVNQGKHDEAIEKELRPKKKTIGGLLGLIGSYAVLLALVGLFTTGLVYKVSGEQFSINNQTVLVIKTGSMSDFYDETIANTYNNDRSLQFNVGDLCVFESVNDNTELVEGEVYGYKQKNIIITHRLAEIREGGYKFRGDNNPVSDGYLVDRENILYHYIGKKVPGIGAFVLYAQSFFGIWSLCGITGILISSEVIYHKINVINKKRYAKLRTSLRLLRGKEDEK